MLAQTDTLKQEYDFIARNVAMIRQDDPTYTPDGFCEDYAEWLANLDAQFPPLPSNDILEDMADWNNAIH